MIALELEDLIRDAGAEIVGSAMSAPEALRMIENHVFTVAILDVRLGDHDSLPVARKLAHVGIPFVFQTGNADTKALSKEWPHALILKKPTAPVTILTSLAAVALNHPR